MSSQSESEILFLDRLRLRRREHVRVEEVLAASACYLAVVSPGEKLVCHFPILLVAWEKEKRQPLLVMIYGKQLRSRIGQQRPLLLRHEVVRSYRIVRPRALAYGKCLVIVA